jgi:hypothetical protein
MVPQNPQTVLGMKVVVPEYIPLHASMCGGCGYAELYCGDMPRLLALLQQGYVWDRDMPGRG